MLKSLFSTRRRKALVTVAICTVLGATSLAVAAWLSSSTGSARGQFGALSATVSYPGTTAGEQGCIPGGTCDLKVSFNNSNSAPVTITGATATALAVDTGGAGSNCSDASLSAVPGGITGMTVTIPANATQDVVLPGLVRLAANADTACQNMTFSAQAKVNYSAGS